MNKDIQDAITQAYKDGAQAIENAYQEGLKDGARNACLLHDEIIRNLSKTVKTLEGIVRDRKDLEGER